MTSSDKDRQLDQALRNAVPDNQPTPDFNAWLQENQAAVQTMQAQAQQAQVKGYIPMRPSNLGLRLMRVAALILIVLGLGFAAGRLSAMRDADLQELRTDLETSLRTSIAATLKTETLGSLNEQWQAVFAANADQLRTEILGQLRQQLDYFAAQTLTASNAATEKRVTELIQLIEAARVRDYQRIATALQQIELNRRRDRAQLGSGLLTLAARTTEQTETRTN